MKMRAFAPSRIADLGNLLACDYPISDAYTRRTISQMFVFRNFAILVQDFDIVSEIFEGSFDPPDFGVIFDVNNNTPESRKNRRALWRIVVNGVNEIPDMRDRVRLHASHAPKVNRHPVMILTFCKNFWFHIAQ